MLFYLFAIIFIFLEVGLFNQISLFSIKPNLILFLLTFYSFYFNFNVSKVLLFCLFCGFLKDIFSFVPFATHMFIFTSLGVCLSYISRRFLRYNWIFIIPLFIFATVSQGFIYALIQAIFFGKELLIFEIFWRIAIVELFYGLLILAVFFRIIKRCVIDKLS